MYKRALLLTAATAALLSGPAYAAGPTQITTKTTTVQKTSTDGNIEITSAGSLVISPPSSSSTTPPPAIEIDSNNTVTLDAGSSITYNGTQGGTAIQADVGHTGEIIDSGAITLTGGTDQTGILITNGTGTAGTFTGLSDTTDNPHQSANGTAIYMASGSSMTITGDGSYGIHEVSGNTLTGDILLDGAIAVSASSTTSTSISSPVSAIELDGAMNGNFTIGSTGTVGGIGAGATGITLLGPLNGAFLNEGTISTSGTAAPTAVTGNPASGTALFISNSVSGGIYNFGPDLTTPSTAAAAITSSGNLPTIQIAPGANATLVAATPIVIGIYTNNPPGVFTVPASFLNLGNIGSAPLNTDTSATAVLMNGTAVDTVTLQGIIGNAGSISAVATTDTKGGGSATVATALELNNYTFVANGLINSNATNGGRISASVGGSNLATAFGIYIGQTSQLPSITNSGVISAAASTTDTTISSLSAYAIFDASGTLSNINNTGTITASATPLDNNQNIAHALDLRANTSGVTIFNSGTILGDVLLGQGPDTLTVQGVNPQSRATLTGTINFNNDTVNNTTDTLIVGSNSVVTGNILEGAGGRIALTVQNSGILDVLNNGATINNVALQTLFPGILPGLTVGTMEVQGGGALDLTLAQAFNLNNPTNVGAIVQSNKSIALDSDAILNLSFGSFVSSPNNGASSFVIFDAPANQLIIASPSQIKTDIEGNIPFLFSASVCAYGTAGPFTNDAGCSATNPYGATSGADLILNLAPKSAATIGLTGYAKTMFPLANVAIANDSTLGAAVIEAGNGITDASAGQQIYQKIYAEFAPDVTGATRAEAISITDQSSGPVGARQRALRMYAGQEGDTTLWGQEFTQRLNVPNKIAAGGYGDSGFGFALGMDGGDPATGRFGGALTFYTGDANEKQPRESKTNSEWYLLTAYQDWRGKGLFFDSQLSAGYGHLDGKRTMSITIPGTVPTIFTRVAEGKRAAALLAGGFSTGFIMNTGGTVFIPQISFDGLTMREEGYTESNNNATTAAEDGFDLAVKPYYAQSLRGFAGFDLRQDLRFGDFYLQPEVRGGYRYDFLSGVQKLKANFVSVPSSTFEISGPDPSKANAVVGGGLAVTTGAWSIGVNYDYKRGIGGTGGVDQTGLITLLGRI